jgi:hypothetical protein
MDVVVGTVVALALVACGAATRREAHGQAGPSELLFVGTSHGIAALHPTDGSVAFMVPGGVATPDWKVLYRTTRQGSGTALRAIAPTDGTTLWSQRLPGDLTVNLATPLGTAVVLGPRYAGPGRAATDLVVGQMGVSRPAFRTYHLSGNVVPEAMALDRTTLFLIDYVPALHPTGYQLRQLDLATGQIGEVRRVDQDETGVMQGVARTHLMARDGSRLYTLYTVAGQRAFVHVLDLRDKYAHCVDLPLPFGTGPQSAVALAMSPDASRIFVADRHSGATAVIDTTQLTIDDVQTLPLAGSSGPASGVMGHDGSLYLASENHVVEVMPLSLDYQSSIDLPGRATALGIAPDGRLVAGLGDGQGLALIDPVNRRTTARFRSKALDGIAFIGAVAVAPLGGDRQSIQCAC